ncbi:MAG: peptide chain release factor N(5)-glutamine methyltransferase [Myxococcales bacterium]|nr:peptide chain release factor N(5)-glutamine methyltransferase [Myxococcales bacterium]MBP6842656.1 peptide chain release factor N(5)-glutamine methyltransferase [Kofleriaceae bacterium]
MTTWTTAAVLDWTTKRFTDAGVVGARLEAQVLLAHALGCTRMQLYTGFDRPLGEEELASARGLIKRRLGGEPLAYLVGEQEFWSRTFEVSPDVLIPRSDTETVVQAVLDRLGADKARPRRGLDLCTGSGILAITLARELPGLTMVATDVSTAAAAVATRNVARHQVGERVEVRVGDLWAPVGDEAFDLIVSNPPYIRQAELAGLDREVQREPRLALDGGADGLGFYRRIVAGLAARLAPGGWIAVEHGHDQGPDVAALLDASGVTAPATTIADLARRPRVTLAARAAGG